MRSRGRSLVACLSAWICGCSFLMMCVIVCVCWSVFSINIPRSFACVLCFKIVLPILSSNVFGITHGWKIV